MRTNTGSGCGGLTVTIAGPVDHVHEVHGLILQQLGDRARSWVSQDLPYGTVRCELPVAPSE